MAKKFICILSAVLVALGCTFTFSACRAGLEFQKTQAVWACDEVKMITDGAELPTGCLFIDGKEYAFTFHWGAGTSALLIDASTSASVSWYYANGLNDETEKIDDKIIWKVLIDEGWRCMYGDVSACKCKQIVLTVTQDYLFGKGETQEHTGKKIILKRQPLEEGQPLFVRSDAVWACEGVSITTDGRANPYGTVAWEDKQYEFLTVLRGGRRICFADRAKLTEEDYADPDAISSEKFLWGCPYFECAGCRMGIGHEVCLQNELGIVVERDYTAERTADSSVAGRVFVLKRQNAAE